jgi:hypothetical protein
MTLKPHETATKTPPAAADESKTPHTGMHGSKTPRAGVDETKTPHIVDAGTTAPRMAMDEIKLPLMAPDEAAHGDR